MKVTSATNNLIQLTRLVAFNCYLVREDDGFTLIDTNMGGQAQAIMKAADELGLPIVRIVLTHAHVDHVGSLDALHEALPDVPVAISAGGRSWSRAQPSPGGDEACHSCHGRVAGERREETNACRVEQD